jgi:hypothetical protein
MGRRRQTLIEPRLISFYSGFFAYIGIRTPLLPVWLQQVKGLASTQIGLVLSCMQFAAVITVPLMAFLADSIGKPRTVIIALGLVRATPSEPRPPRAGQHGPVLGSHEIHRYATTAHRAHFAHVPRSVHSAAPRQSAIAPSHETQ